MERVQDIGEHAPPRKARQGLDRFEPSLGRVRRGASGGGGRGGPPGRGWGGGGGAARRLRGALGSTRTAAPSGRPSPCPIFVGQPPAPSPPGCRRTPCCAPRRSGPPHSASIPVGEPTRG